MAAHLHDFQLAYHGVALNALSKPDQAIGHGENRVGVGFSEILADEERRRLPRRHQHAQLLNELRKVVIGVVLGLAGQHHGAERIDKHQGRRMRFDFADDAPQHLVQVPGQGIVGQVDVTDRLVDRFAVEKVELLLITQHLQWRFTQDGKEQRRAFRRCQGKHHLVGQRGLAATRRAGNQIERKFRQSSTQHLVQSRHAGGQTVDSHFGAHGEFSCEGVSLKEGSHTPRSKLAVSEGPISVVRSS